MVGTNAPKRISKARKTTLQYVQHNNGLLHSKKYAFPMLQIQTNYELSVLVGLSATAIFDL